jgi:uncharacterized protein
VSRRVMLVVRMMVLLAFCAPVPASAADGAGQGLRPTSFAPLPLGSIKPAGWLKGQLRIQAAGLSGHLDEFWPDIKQSAWFGGSAEGWERVPYWLDGIVPLAYLLDDDALKTKVKKAIDYILDHQHPDGWLGPLGDLQKHQPYDVWPLFPLFKALTQYQEASGDPRVVPTLLKCCRKIDEVIARRPMYSWARFRAADFAVTLFWLYDRSPEPWLLELGRKAFAQSHDWRAQFDHFRFTGRTEGKFELDTHGVNTGMALKYGAVRFRLSGDASDKGAILQMLDLLDRYHGQATGIFTCDEHLAGRNPSQGTELCTVVEAMYSLEVAASILGDPRLGDRLEEVAFNALPATFKKDMTAHQYDQQCNQVICSAAGEHVYVDNRGDANLYGLEPNFGCCTANMHQGWPKFVSNLWMKTSDGGLAVTAYAPCVVETKIQGKPVTISVDTDYPFREEIIVRVTAPDPLQFPIHLRLPGWSAPAELKQGDVARVVSAPPTGQARWHVVNAPFAGNSLALRLAMPARLYRGYNDSVAIKRGPLVFALPIAPRWSMLVDRPGLPFDDWEVLPESPWNYAQEIDRDHPERSVIFEERALGASPFSPEGAPVLARVKGRRVAGWRLEKGAAAPPPASPAASTEPIEPLTLIPYGCTDLRITEFPFLGAR